MNLSDRVFDLVHVLVVPLSGLKKMFEASEE